MIQRIQSVFLSLASIAGILMLIPFEKMPLAKFYGEMYSLHLHSLYLENLIPGEISPFNEYFTLPLFAGLVLITVISLISIFLYKNRSMQMLFIKINIFISIIVLGGFFFGYINAIEDKLGVQAIYNYNSFLPALILLFLVLAFRSVKKDDKLVKSMDRIR
ncbi:MAG: DUF4293 domain-containing protein [Bacteroidales bacterium]|jgi:glucan phosphoethanolaminetransferase (alkaline phosphatase superfamily)|nr:DUF4293 domain-containing protein [Bacteroidales bacterium]